MQRPTSRSLALLTSPALLLAAPAAILATPAAAQVRANAPVAPDAIYIGRAAGLSVLDLNGFGQSTGDPTYVDWSQGDPEYGHSNFPNNPNVRFHTGLEPALAVGTTTRNGGSAGVFTLVRNSALDDVLVRTPSLRSISDMMLGHALDVWQNDAAFPFGCQHGGGSVCAVDGLKHVRVALGSGLVLQPANYGGVLLNDVPGGENPVSWSPHPNPPPLVDRPLCLDPFLPVQEPTSIDSALASKTNLLVPGDPWGDPVGMPHIPPTGLLGLVPRTWFFGPSTGTTITDCAKYMYRQSIGHFLYVADRKGDALVVLNSNTMEELARLALEDPTELAMSPDLDRLAVSQATLDRVTFVDIDPTSATFHQIVGTVDVGDEPRGIAWDPADEDVLVCCQGSDELWILSSASQAVRKVVATGLDRPFALAIAQRQVDFAFDREVYYAFVLDREGTVGLFESGPDGPNGWGYDDMVGHTAFRFVRPKAIQPDPVRPGRGVWIAHEGQLDVHGQPTGLDGGALSNLVLDGPTTGKLPLRDSGPDMRGLTFRIEASIGSNVLTGVPLDLAFDDLFNFGALENVANVFSHGTVARLNGKSQVRSLGSAGLVATNHPMYVMATVWRPEGEVVDVIDLTTRKRLDTNRFEDGVQSVPARGARVLMDYYRQ